MLRVGADPLAWTPRSRCAVASDSLYHDVKEFATQHQEERSTVEFPVMIVGAGPVGLTLAASLAKLGIRSILLEKKANIDEHSRALAVAATTLEILHSLGLADECMTAGTFLREIGLYDINRQKVALRMSFEEVAGETAYPGMLFLSQSRLESILLDGVRANGLCDIRFDHQFASYQEMPAGISVTFIDSRGVKTTTTVSFLVGCDGAHSAVRQCWGQALEGITFPVRVFLFDVKMADSFPDNLPFPRFYLTRSRLVAAIRYEAFHWRILFTRPVEETDEESENADNLPDLVARLFGPGQFEQIWSGVFSIHSRIAASFRRGRVLLAGDAAHISSPAGGQGMNSGMQDADNLAWKLALALKGGDVERLLNSYHQERHSAVATGVLPFTTRLSRFPLRPRFFRVALSPLALALRSKKIRRAAGRGLAMLGTRYKKSCLILGRRKWAGRSAPGASLGTSTVFIFDASGKILKQLEQTMSELHCECLPFGLTLRSIERTDPLWKRWRARSNLVALVRPDGYTGWAALGPSAAEMLIGIRRALGMAGPASYCND